MKEIGGFFELELPIGKEYHSEALRLNKARSALYYLIKSKNIKKIYIPHYTCETISYMLDKLKINYEKYRINENFLPIINTKIKESESLLYTNYYGINQSKVEKVKQEFKNVIIDNSQAFFSVPLDHTDTFYSPRKFFGVSDGSYLYTDNKDSIKLDQSFSYDSMEFLLKRIDISPQHAYELFKQHEEHLTNQNFLEMSKLTRRILSSIDYNQVASIRLSNFNFIHKYLRKYNMINIQINDKDIPMVYPLLLEKTKIHTSFIKEKIFVATYWPGVSENVKEDWFEHTLVQRLIPLPIDQRYDHRDMERIVEVALKLVK